VGNTENHNLALQGYKGWFTAINSLHPCYNYNIDWLSSLHASTMIIQIHCSEVNYSSKTFNEMKLMHETKVYPPRIKMTVQMKSDNPFTLRVKVKGSNSDKNLSVELLFPLMGMSLIYSHTACWSYSGCIHIL
jgi:hypothetical protein